jgi:signal transduction histidine kinase
MEPRTFFASLAVAAMAGLLLIIDLSLPMGVAAGIPYVLVVLLSAWLPFVQMPLYMAALCSVLTVAGGLSSPPGGVIWIGITNRVLGIIVLWVTAFLVLRRRRTEERLRHVNQELDAFVRTVSHDLRSPLSPILGFADYLREEHGHCLRKEGLVALDEIESQGRRMLATLDDLLQLAMVGYLERPPGPVDVDRVVREVLAGWRDKAAVTGDELCCGKLPPAAIPESLLAQIFDNLVGNAVRYAAGSGPVEIGGEREAGVVRFFVRDHGPGIVPEERERIFEVFRRGTSVRSIPGTGVGLATVRKIAVNFGGRAWVEETPGGGSTFWVEMAEPEEKCELRHFPLRARRP